jgi:hypothetical protein
MQILSLEEPERKQYVIKFVSDLRQEWWFSPGSAVSSTNKTDSHNINEILIMQ